MDFQNLTKKNQEFVHIATNRLIQDGKSDSEIRAILEEYLPSILEKQAQGIPARSFLGAPTLWAASFSEKNKNAKAPDKEKNTNPWLMWLDTSLLFIGLVALMTAMMAFFNTNAPVTGLTSILALGFGGGASMYATYYYIYRHMGADKSQKPSWLKSILVLSLVMVFWMALYYSATAFLPAALNPQLPPFVLSILGGGALLLRYYLQKKYNVKNALTARQ
ncbi:DUF1129 domain-containing protein [Streptococcus didelphis]|uniref:DUF1129 domain-containing protein n=1 Tax=Streptococcus didelphis TaxID=102886 RepID=UPI00037173C5|nr:DUF1129 family protein [Streptococcus didelphis]